MHRDFWLEEKIAITVNELKYIRSVDGFLVKLSSLLYDIIDECFGDSSCARSYFEKALNHPTLRQELARLSCHVDIVEKTLMGDPRFKLLRQYGDILMSVLGEIECVSGLPEISRDATFRLEKREVNQPKAVKPLQKVKTIEWEKIVVYVSITVAIILVVIALLRLLV